MVVYEANKPRTIVCGATATIVDVPVIVLSSRLEVVCNMVESVPGPVARTWA